MKYFRIRPLLTVPGVLLALYGFWLFSHPIAYILAGLVLIALPMLRENPYTTGKTGIKSIDNPPTGEKK